METGIFLNNNLNKSKNISIQKYYNYGLAILKVILALDVIVSHNFNKDSTKNKFLLFILRRRRLHVPSFFIMSFYFMYNDLIKLDKKKIKNRLERLVIPYIGWAIIIWILNNLLKFFFKIIYHTELNHLINQILWGNIYIIQFWFQWNLIFITILFIIIIVYIRNNYKFIFLLLTIFSYILQYSGYNKKFYKFLSSEKKKCLSRLAVMMPYAVTGFILSFFKIINILKKNVINVFILSLTMFIFLGNYSVFLHLDDIPYSGIEYNIRSIYLISIFSIIPFEKISNKLIINILKYITNYTAGIFYLHWSIIIYLRNFVEPVKRQTFLGCIIIYFICYIISFIGIYILGKTKFKYLFS